MKYMKGNNGGHNLKNTGQFLCDVRCPKVHSRIKNIYYHAPAVFTDHLKIRLFSVDKMSKCES